MSHQSLLMLWRVSALLAATLYLISSPLAQGQAASSAMPTFSATSRLVYLDVTVSDRKGRPVVRGLTRDDFTITENGKKQHIFSFEAPQSHVINRKAEDDAQRGNVPPPSSSWIF